MNRYINILLLTALLSLIAGVVSSQVTVGSANPPASFSTLQIEGNTGGLRLPQLNEAEKGVLNIGNDDAGLMIYNRNMDRVEYWDGNKWLTVGDTLKIYNGIHLDGDRVKLGGKLTENTAIDFNNKQLQFSTRDNGSYSVGDTLLVVGNKVVSMKPAKLSVNRDVLSIAGKKVDVMMDSLSEFKTVVGDNVLHASNDTIWNILLDGSLQYKEGNEGNNKVLLSKASGEAYWGLLKPDAIIKTGNILPGGTVIRNSQGSLPSISDVVTLEPGKWLIFAKFSTQTNSSTRMFSWGDIMADDGVSTTLVSSIGADVDNSGLAFPQLVHLIILEKETKVFIRCSTSNNPTTLTDAYAKPVFMAILIDKPLD